MISSEWAEAREERVVAWRCSRVAEREPSISPTMGCGGDFFFFIFGVGLLCLLNDLLENSFEIETVLRFLVGRSGTLSSGDICKRMYFGQV